MSYEVDARLFNNLSECDPLEVCARTGCRYDQEKNHYHVGYWGDQFLVDCQVRRVEQCGSAPRKVHDYVPIFLLNYLMQAREVLFVGEWISEKDMVGGATFFRGPHEVPTRLISSRFGNDIASFSHCCERLQGVAIEMADAAYLFTPCPHISVAMLYWLGDDEFPAEVKLLFDRSIAGIFALDTIYALVVDICSRLSRA